MCNVVTGANGFDHTTRPVPDSRQSIGSVPLLCAVVGSPVCVPCRANASLTAAARTLRTHGIRQGSGQHGVDVDDDVEIGPPPFRRRGIPLAGTCFCPGRISPRNRRFPRKGGAALNGAASPNRFDAVRARNDDMVTAGEMAELAPLDVTYDNPGLDARVAPAVGHVGRSRLLHACGYFFLIFLLLVIPGDSLLPFASTRLLPVASLHKQSIELKNRIFIRVTPWETY